MNSEEMQLAIKEARETYDKAIIAANVILREAQLKHQRDLQTALSEFQEKTKALQGSSVNQGSI